MEKIILDEETAKKAAEFGKAEAAFYVPGTPLREFDLTVDSGKGHSHSKEKHPHRPTSIDRGESI